MKFTKNIMLNIQIENFLKDYATPSIMDIIMWILEDW